MTTPPRIVVSVGTDHHPFDRLVRWVAELAVDEGVSCFVQYGTASSPTGVGGAPLIPHEELLELFSTADVIVTHGGPATIMDARRCDRRPIVLPRDPSSGEHVDDHQVLFATRLAAEGVIDRVEDRDQLRAAIRAGLGDPASMRAGIAGDVPAPAVASIARLVEALERDPSRSRGRRRRARDRAAAPSMGQSR